MLASRALALILAAVPVFLAACSSDPTADGSSSGGAGDGGTNGNVGGGSDGTSCTNAKKDGAAPGTFAGRNANGIEIAGDLLHWVNDGEYLFNWTFSWERHGANLNNQNWRTAWPEEPNGYYAIGFRCAYD